MADWEAVSQKKNYGQWRYLRGKMVFLRTWEKLTVMRANVLTEVGSAGWETALCTKGERIMGRRRP